MFYVGIDVAKNKHDIAVIDSEGTVSIRHLRIKNNREGFDKLLSTLKNLTKSSDDKIQLTLENTGHYCFNLLSFLQKEGYSVFSYNPLLIKVIHQAPLIT